MDKLWTVIGYGFWAAIVAWMLSPIFTAPKITCTTEPIAFNVNEAKTSHYDKGERHVDVEGKDGERKVCTKEDGSETSNDITISPIDEEVTVGTYVAPKPEQEPIYIAPQPTGGGAICNDGWHSLSIGKGTCSRHHGIDYYL